MKRLLLPLTLLIVAVACGESADSNNGESAGQSSTASVPATSSEGTASASSAGAGSSAATPAAQQGASGGIPERCQEGFASYLTTIEPLVAAYDPASASLNEWSAFRETVRAKSVELLMANNARAPYSCSEINLEWAYFDMKSPWDAILPFAEERAPGTVAYLETVRDYTSSYGAQLEDYVTGGCDAAAEAVRQAIAAEIAAGRQQVADMPVPEGLEMLNLYNAYMSKIQQEECPRDQLGNTEYMFIRAF